MFPLHHEVFVRPRDVYLSASQVGTVFAHIGDVNGETSAHRFVDRLLDLDLGGAGLGPVALQGFPAVDDLDVGATLVVSGPPQRHELLAGLSFPLWCRDYLRHLDR